MSVPTLPRTAEGLRALAAEAAGRLEDASAEDVLRWAAATFGDRLAVTSSMTDAVVVSLAAGVAPGVDVVFLDTGYHFPETLRTRDLIAARYDVRVRSVTPALTVAEQDAHLGPRLHDRDPDRCCGLRKVAPLARAMAGYDAWVTGLRRDESPERAGTPVVAYDARRGKVKVNPIARWTRGQVDAYVAAHDVVVNPLLAQGYPSIGCAPCTRRPAAGDERGGRWAGTGKTECGLHDR